MKFFRVMVVSTCFFLTQCAVLHKVQIGNIDNTRQSRSKKVDLKISETGVNLREAAGIVGSLKKNPKFSDSVADAVAFIELFQMGPRTGNAVFFENYARNINEALIAKCPSGNLSNILTIRETAKYPVVTGEIIRVIADCNQKRKSR